MKFKHLPLTENDPQKKIVNHIRKMVIGEKYDESIQESVKVLGSYPQSPIIMLFLGISLYAKQMIKDSLDLLNTSLRLNPENYLTSHYLGLIMIDADKKSTAIKCFDRAIHLNPNSYDSYYQRSLLYADAGNYHDLKKDQERMLEINPRNITNIYDLAVSLRFLGENKYALRIAAKADKQSPNNHSIINLIGSIYEKMNDLNNAEIYFDKAAKLSNEALYKFNRASTQLKKGNFIEGWDGYRNRIPIYKQKGAHLDFDSCVWDGESLKEKVIIIHTEMGYGDTFNFIRYAELVKKLGCTVIVHCKPEVVSLLSTVRGIDQLVLRGEEVPQHDYHIPLMSLPYVFKTTIDTVPQNIPYFTVEKKKYSHKIDQVEGKMKVGIVWAGSPTHINDHNRSLNLELFSNLSTMKNVQLFSIQKCDRRYDIEKCGFGEKIVDLSGDISSYSDTAAFIDQFDLLISADTSVAHLSGALDKETWVFIPYCPDFRWMLNRDDTPWYPKMTLFRQEHEGDWAHVMDKVEIKLAERAQAKLWLLADSSKGSASEAIAA